MYPGISIAIYIANSVPGAQAGKNRANPRHNLRRLISHFLHVKNTLAVVNDNVITRIFTVEGTRVLLKRNRAHMRQDVIIKLLNNLLVKV
jgi:hypothetical protein